LISVGASIILFAKGDFDMETEKLSISLPKDMAQRIRHAVAGGLYSSDSDIIREAVLLWEKQEQEDDDRLLAIRASLDAAAESEEWLTDDEIGRRFDERLAAALRK
jgi:antitoxin ParD1/3/4